MLTCHVQYSLCFVFCHIVSGGGTFKLSELLSAWFCIVFAKETDLGDFLFTFLDNDTLPKNGV